MTIALAPLFAADPIKGAYLSADGVHRYALWRVWEPAANKLTVCMLNPSTADARADDPTIRRLIGFAKRDGYGGIMVVNLYAYRSPYPEALSGRHYDQIVGPENNAMMEAVVQQGDRVLLGWGAAPWAAFQGGRMRRDDVLNFLKHVEAKAVCLGRTAAGEPRHPLYVRGDQPFEEFG